MGSPTVNAPVLHTTWRALERGPLLLSGTAAAVLVGATTLVLDDGYAVQVLRGAAILLAGGLAVALDDPAADLLAASPTTLARRWAARLGLAIGVTAGCWGLLLAWVGGVVHGVPWLALSVEAAALGGLALAISAALRRWRDVREPARSRHPCCSARCSRPTCCRSGGRCSPMTRQGRDGRQRMDVGRPSWSPQSPWSPLRVRTPRAADFAGAD